MGKAWRGAPVPGASAAVVAALVAKTSAAPARASARSAEGEEEETAAPDCSTLPALVAFQVKTAAKARQDLVEQWREVCKPRKQGGVAAQPRGAKVDFPPLFEEWLAARGLADALERQEDQRGWLVYRYKRQAVVASESNWEQAFHGTWWYPLWLILDSGVMLESNDKGLGHDFWEPGVYCTPNLETARWYARPHILFGDGTFHRVMLELRVDPEKRKRERQRGGVQWVFNTSAIAIHGVWIQVNSPPMKGEERVNEWDPLLEALPTSQNHQAAIINPRSGPWPDVEEDDDDVEQYSIPHLGVYGRASASAAPHAKQESCPTWDRAPAALMTAPLSRFSAPSRWNFTSNSASAWSGASAWGVPEEWHGNQSSGPANNGNRWAGSPWAPGPRGSAKGGNKRPGPRSAGREIPERGSVALAMKRPPEVAAPRPRGAAAATEPQPGKWLDMLLEDTEPSAKHQKLESSEAAAA